MLKVLRKYRQLAYTGFREASIYRLYAITSLAGSLLFLLLMYYIWNAIASTSPIGSSVIEIVTYLGVAQFVRVLTIADIERELGPKIRRGDIVNELKKPISLASQMFFYELGRRVFYFFARSIPILLVLVLVLGADLPGGLRLTAFTVSLLLALGVGTAMSYLFAMFIFWTKVEWSLSMTRYLLIQFFGGVMFPLYLLPEAWKPLFLYLPFRSMIDAPVSIFVGRTALEDLSTVYITQIGWIVALSILAAVVWKLAKKKLTVQGG